MAIVGAVMELYGKPVSSNLHLVHKLAQYAHATAQGKVGSGFDVSASCFGGHAYSRYSPEIIKAIGDNPSPQALAKAMDEPWDYVATPLGLPQGFLVAFGNFVGQSTSTGPMVKKVNELKAAKPEEYKLLMHELDRQNRVAIEALARINKLASSKPEEYSQALSSGGKHILFTEFRKAFVAGREITRELGVKAGAPIEPPECTRLIEESQAKGAFAAKLPGAGGVDAIAALCLSEQSKKQLENFWMGYEPLKTEPVPINTSNVGVKAESLAAWQKIWRIAGQRA